MANTPTPHIGCHPGDFARTVLMPGDPLRAKFIAETFLEDPRLVTDVRGMYGYTGTYQAARQRDGQRHGHAVHRHLFLRAVHPVRRREHHPHRLRRLLHRQGKTV